MDIKNNSTLTTSLVSVWLSDGSGLTTDLHGSNTATNNGATLATGLNGDAAQFVGASTQYINTNYGANFGTDPSISVSLWVKTTDTGDVRTFGGIADTPDAIDPTIQHFLNSVTAGDPGAQFNLQGSTNLSVNDDAHPVNDGSTWHHLVLVRDGSGNTLSIYVDNNTPVSSADTRTGNMDFSSNPFYIGATNLRGTPASYFTGYIHQVCFWTKALTAAEVAALYNGGAGIYYDESYAPRSKGGLLLMGVG